MHKKISYLFLAILLFLFNACGGSGSSGNYEGFSDDEKSFLYALFKTEYLWYAQVTSSPDYSIYTVPQGMINALRVNPPDKWSYMLTRDQYEHFANQQTAGFGFGYTSDLTIFLVRINAPAYGKLYRGDKIIEINGESATPTLITQASANLNSAATFTVMRDNNLIDVEVTPSPYSFNVSLGKVIDRNGKKIGYLRFDSFTESSVGEFETIFTDFKNAGIDELVIDLRYNGGGFLSVTSALLDNITTAYPNQRQFYLDWNDKYQQNNSAYTFEDTTDRDGNELNMQRIFFLVTKNSASASEALVNALTPYLGESNVITIGDYTHGKSVGMRGKVYGDHFYFLINFFVRNNAAETTSFNGIDPHCNIDDDLTHLMGDTNETMLAAALYYIDNNTCP